MEERERGGRVRVRPRRSVNQGAVLFFCFLFATSGLVQELDSHPHAAEARREEQGCHKLSQEDLGEEWERTAVRDSRAVRDKGLHLHPHPLPVPQSVKKKNKSSGSDQFQHCACLSTLHPHLKGQNPHRPARSTTKMSSTILNGALSGGQRL
jgi:hypothetical protein